MYSTHKLSHTYMCNITQTMIASYKFRHIIPHTFQHTTNTLSAPHIYIYRYYTHTHINRYIHTQYSWPGLARILRNCNSSTGMTIYMWILSTGKANAMYIKQKNSRSKLASFMGATNPVMAAISTWLKQCSIGSESPMGRNPWVRP